MYGSLNAWMLAQTASAPTPLAPDAGNPTWLEGLKVVGVLLVVFVLPFVLGRFFAKTLRMPTHASSFAVVLASIFGSAVVLTMLPLRYGPDIRGGTNLVYELDRAATTGTAATRVTASDLIPKLTQRLNPSGTKEILIRPSGSDQIEIVVPNVNPQEVEELKRVIQNAGILQFRIVANRSDHQDIIQLARKQANSENETERLTREVRDSDGAKVVGLWQAVGRDEKARDGIFAFKTPIDGDIIRDAKTGKLIEDLAFNPTTPLAFEKALLARGIQDVDVLLALERRGIAFDLVTGDDLAVVRRNMGKDGTPEVGFDMKSSGATKLQSLTYMNRPENGIKRRMAIVLDGRVLSAPNLNQPISSQGVITGNFTSEECDYLVNVLKSGSLPAALNKQPISENVVGAAQGQDAIAKGFLACILSLAVTLALILGYYRFSGAIACIAMAINLALILAGMILIQQPITLPGLAGLVLSVGMSVDANVLVFERIREEIAKKSTPRLAIRNGFDRAWTTIIDSNLTTLISALVLYFIGSDQVKGFAVTLIIGLIVSMFTAVFCSRVMFDIAEKLRFVNFSMADGIALLKKSLVGDREIDFMSMRFACYSISLVLIVIGLVATTLRGRQILDIDFNGGTSVTFALNEPVPTDKVRELVGGMFVKDEAGLPIQTSLTNVSMAQFKPESVYKLDTSLRDVKKLSESLVSGFTEEKTGTTLASYRVEASPAQDQPTAESPKTDEAKPDETKPDPASEPKAAKVKRTLKFSTSNNVDSAKISGPALLESIVVSAKAAGVTLVDSQIGIFPEGAEDWTRDSQVGYATWDVTLPVDGPTSDKILADLSAQLAKQPVWQSINRIESRVAGEMQRDAILALFLSMIFITAYIWFRFQRVAYGLAAVVALIHDVLITLTAIAVSHWLFQPLSSLLIEDFKISLTMVAAFLTIAGYSLNDTIVVFDRIREVKGKSPKLTSEMVNQSVNQTLSRTLLTSATTIFAVFLLYVFGGEALHGFSFALFVGIVVGTYSSIFVAAPILLWLTDREHSTSRIGSK
jgi:SecD/SecF fusion protein